MLYPLFLGVAAIAIGVAFITNFAGIGDWSIRQNKLHKGSPFQGSLAPTTSRGNKGLGAFAIGLGIFILVATISTL